MNLKPYPQHRAAEIPWLKTIPSHWEVNRAKWILNKVDRPTRDEDDVVTCFRDGIVTLRKLRRVTGFTESLKEIGYQGIRKGDLVIHQMDAFAGAIGVSDSDGKSTPVYSVCIPKDIAFSTHYYASIVREMARSEYILSLSRGIRERSTDFRFETFKNLFLPIPPPEEQKQITCYLDWKTMQIAKFIKAKKRLIELLKEQKQVIINDAVTGKIDVHTGKPFPKYKDSGVEWLRMVPEEWKIKRLKDCSLIVLGKMLKTTPETGYVLKPYLRSVNVQWFKPSLQDVSEMYFSIKEMDTFRIQNNDILICEGGETGRSCIWQNEIEECYIQNSVHKVTCSEDIIPIFLLYQLQSIVKTGYINSIVNRVSIGHLTREKLVIVPLTIPSLENQKNIIHFIQDKTNNIDLIIDRIEREISQIQEFRTRLIADVVTGKVDVRDILVPDLKEEDVIAELEDTKDTEEVPDDTTVENDL